MSRDSEPVRVRVSAESPYDVVIGRGMAGAAARAVPESAARAVVIRPDGLAGLVDAVTAGLAAAGLRVHEVVVPDGEAAKTAEVAADCWRQLGLAGCTRSDVVVGVGGGATTDLAGFVAATFLRGMRVVLVPTTLLGMVDAAVGGKNGIDTAQGKNLVGTFHEPVGVVCDLDLLARLPPAELSSGLAEVVKCGLIADAGILDLVRRDPRAAADPGGPVLAELVVRSVRVKAEVVSADLREAAGDRVGREMLNYGHTLGHAIERVERFRIRHGEAVAIGLVYAAELARLTGRLGPGEVATHRELLTGAGLPTSYPGGRWAELRAAMNLDKKTRGDTLRFVLLDGIGNPTIVPGPPEELLVEAYLALSGPESSGPEFSSPVSSSPVSSSPESSGPAF